MKTNARLVLCFVAAVFVLSGALCLQYAFAAIKPAPPPLKAKACMIGFHNHDIRINTNAAGFTSANYPQIACDSKGHVYVVWQDNRDGKFDIYFNYSSDNGATWQTSDIKITSTAPGTNYCNSPQIACDEDGSVFIVWVDSRDVGAPNIYFNHSSNYGAGWHSDVRISTATPPVTPFAEYPQISCDNNGNVYVAWRDNRNNSWDIYFDYSSDYGANWHTDDIRLDNGTGVSGFPEISCNQQGNIYVVWDDNRNGYSDIYFNTSQNYGTTWQAQDIRVDIGIPAVRNSWSPQISCDENGSVYVTWKETQSDGSGQPYFNYSWDYGFTWQSPATGISIAWQVTMGGPRISSDGQGNVYVVWYDCRNQHADIFLNHSSDYGLSWLSSELRIDTDKPQFGESFYPEIACNGNGRAYVAWDDDRNNSAYRDIYFNFSSNHAASWKATDMRVDRDNPAPGVSCWAKVVTDKAGTAYVVWQDNRNGTDDVYFNYAGFLK